MTIQPIIAVGAAVASALLFLVLAQGSVAGVVASFTPLPIMIAALGWGHRTGLLAAAIASLLFLSTLSLPYVVTYLLEFGLPGWYLAFLALLARSGAPAPGSPSNEPPQIWYPVGQLVVWSTCIAAAIVMVLMFMSGTADGPMREAAARTTELLRNQMSGALSDKEMALLTAVVVRILPLVNAGALTLVYLVNLWTAARVVRLSGRLVRPWPDLPEHLRLPQGAGAVFVVALVLYLVLPTTMRSYAAVIAATLGTGLAVHALALVHALTRSMRLRPAILATLYVAIVILPLVLLALVALALADLVRPLVPRHDGPPRRPTSP